MQFTSDFQEKDIVYGGDKKLKTLLKEAKELFPLAKGISVLSECPVGLIGDDINSVAKKLSKELDLPVIPCNCEGFRGVSQSLGTTSRTTPSATTSSRPASSPSRPALTTSPSSATTTSAATSGRVKPLLEEIGLNVKAVWTGDGEMEKIAATHKVKLNLIHCYRSMNYMCKVMEEKYGIPWLEFNFFGPTKIRESLRKIAERFDDSIKEKVEAAIAKYDPIMQAVIDEYRPRLEGKKVMLYVGGLRPRHTVNAYEDLGMMVVGSGYEFAHSDDYERTSPGDARSDRHLRRRLRARAGGIRQQAAARPGRLRHQGEVPVPEDGHPLPPDAQLGLLRPVPRATTASRSSPATSTWP